MRLMPAGMAPEPGAYVRCRTRRWSGAHRARPPRPGAGDRGGPWHGRGLGPRLPWPPRVCSARPCCGSSGPDGLPAARAVAPPLPGHGRHPRCPAGRGVRHRRAGHAAGRSGAAAREPAAEQAAAEASLRAWQDALAREGPAVAAARPDPAGHRRALPLSRAHPGRAAGGLAGGRGRRAPPRRTCPAPPRSTRTGASRWPTATGGRSAGGACQAHPGVRAVAAAVAGLAVALLAAQRPLETVPPLDEQAAQRRQQAGGRDQVVGRLDHRAVVGDRVRIGHEPLRHVAAPVAIRRRRRVLMYIYWLRGLALEQRHGALVRGGRIPGRRRPVVIKGPTELIENACPGGCCACWSRGGTVSRGRCAARSRPPGGLTAAADGAARPGRARPAPPGSPGAPPRRRSGAASSGTGPRCRAGSAGGGRRPRPAARRRPSRPGCAREAVQRDRGLLRVRPRRPPRSSPSRAQALQPGPPGASAAASLGRQRPGEQAEPVAQFDVLAGERGGGGRQVVGGGGGQAVGAPPLRAAAGGRRRPSRARTTARTCRAPRARASVSRTPGSTVPRSSPITTAPARGAPPGRARRASPRRRSGRTCPRSAGAPRGTHQSRNRPMTWSMRRAPAWPKAAAQQAAVGGVAGRGEAVGAPGRQAPVLAAGVEGVRRRADRHARRRVRPAAPRRRRRRGARRPRGRATIPTAMPASRAARWAAASWASVSQAARQWKSTRSSSSCAGAGRCGRAGVAQAAGQRASRGRAPRRARTRWRGPPGLALLGEEVAVGGAPPGPSGTSRTISRASRLSAQTASRSISRPSQAAARSGGRQRQRAHPLAAGQLGVLGDVLDPQVHGSGKRREEGRYGEGSVGAGHGRVQRVDLDEAGAERPPAQAASSARSPRSPMPQERRESREYSWTDGEPPAPPGRQRRRPSSGPPGRPVGAAGRGAHVRGAESRPWRPARRAQLSSPTCGPAGHATVPVGRRDSVRLGLAQQLAADHPMITDNLLSLSAANR